MRDWRMRLYVKGAGFYEAESLMPLLWEVLKHRMWHLWHDWEWKD